MATDKETKKSELSSDKKIEKAESINSEKQTKQSGEYKEILKAGENKKQEVKNKESATGINDIPIIPSFAPTMPITPVTPTVLPPINGNGADKTAGSYDPILPDMGVKSNVKSTKTDTKSLTDKRSEMDKERDAMAKKVETVDIKTGTSSAIASKTDKKDNGVKTDSNKQNSGSKPISPLSQSGTSKPVSVSASGTTGGGSKPPLGTGDKKEPPKKKEYGGMIFFWIIVLGVAALLIGIGISGGNSLANANTTIEGLSAMRLGQTQVYTAKVSNENATFGEEVNVVWSVGDKVVKQAKATDKDAFCYSYTPKATGNVELSVKIGDYANLYKARKITVNRPLLTVTMNSHKIVYGDEIPEYTYKIEGFIDNDTAESLNLKVAGGVAGGITKAGTYKINTLNNLSSDKYDISIKTGSIEVEKRNIKIADNTIYKVYDGKNVCENCDYKFDNLVQDDEVKLNAKAIFTDKNVGNKAVTLSGVKLSGKSAENYEVEDLKNVKGVIVAKELVLDKLVAADKIYDGTTYVTFNSVGTLEGVVSGDSVTVGSIKARFENSAVGNDKKVIIESITLVGKDAGNYTVKVTADVEADIKAVGR